ncbi:MAG: hypothetical protein R3C01_18300 [Planctomycetaceae bacterium]
MPDTPSPKSPTSQTSRSSRAATITTIVLGVVILIPSMAGFVNKFYEFFHATHDNPDGAYVLTPMVNYVLASGGFFCFLIWSTGQGMFHDIEAPKQTMLDRESELDVDEVVCVPPWAGGPNHT